MSRLAHSFWPRWYRTLGRRDRPRAALSASAVMAGVGAPLRRCSDRDRSAMP